MQSNDCDESGILTDYLYSHSVHFTIYPMTTHQTDWNKVKLTRRHSGNHTVDSQQLNGPKRGRADAAVHSCVQTPAPPLSFPCIVNGNQTSQTYQNPIVYFYGSIFLSSLLFDISENPYLLNEHLRNTGFQNLTLFDTGLVATPLKSMDIAGLVSAWAGVWLNTVSAASTSKVPYFPRPRPPKLLGCLTIASTAAIF